LFETEEGSFFISHSRSVSHSDPFCFTLILITFIEQQIHSFEMIEKEFTELLNEYWNVATECYDKILSVIKTDDYEPKGRIPNANFSHAHHGSGYEIVLDTGIRFDFDFYIKQLAGFAPYSVFNYLRQVKDRFPALADLEHRDIEDLFKVFENNGIMVQHHYNILFRWSNVPLESW